MQIPLYCIVSYCIVLYCIVLYCIVLYCTVLYCIVLYCIVLTVVLYCMLASFDSAQNPNCYPIDILKIGPLCETKKQAIIDKQFKTCKERFANVSSEVKEVRSSVRVLSNGLNEVSGWIANS